MSSNQLNTVTVDDESRVKLQAVNEDGSDYINSSFVDVSANALRIC